MAKAEAHMNGERVLPTPPKLTAVKRVALTIEKRGAQYAIVELHIEDGRVVSEALVKAEYYRDLAEDVAYRRLRRLGR